MTKFYKNGFYETNIPGSVKITDAYWQELLKGQANGKIITQNSDGYPILTIPGDTRSYKEKREAEYPSIGDMIDALIKAHDGDNEELNALCKLRKNIKGKYPKS